MGHRKFNMFAAVLLAVCSLATLAAGAPLTVPIMENDRSKIISTVNKYRASLQAANMEALTEWSTDLEARAQDIGAKCEVTATDDTYGAGSLLDVTQVITVDTLADALKTEEAKYTVGTDTCNASAIDKCNGYKQFVWYKGGKIGCAITICDANGPNGGGNTFTCVFEHKATLDPSQKPYVKGTACTFCSSSWSTCDNGLCTSSNVLAPTTSCGSKPSKLTPLHRFVYKATSATILSQSQTITDSTIAPLFEYQGIFGYVSSSEDSACGQLRPLMKLSAVGKIDFVYVVGEEFLSLYNQNNYNYVETLGYVVPNAGFCEANATAHQFIRAAAYNYYTADDKEADVLLLREGANAVYWFVDNAFSFWSSA